MALKRYAKMQYRSLSGSAPFLAFDDIVPQDTSTAHVAAAALYHCLGASVVLLPEPHYFQPQIVGPYAIMSELVH